MGHQSYPKRKFKQIGIIEGKGSVIDKKTGITHTVNAYVQDFTHLKFWHNGQKITKAEHDKLFPTPV